MSNPIRTVASTGLLAISATFPEAIIIYIFSDSHQFWPQTFRLSLMEELHGHQADLFVQHVRDSPDIDKLMPKNVTLYITTVRDPVTLLESLYGYYSHGR